MAKKNENSEDSKKINRKNKIRTARKKKME